MPKLRPIFRRFRRDRSGWILPSASAGFRADGWLRFLARKSSGKTTLTLHAIAEVQKTGGVAAFIDAEHALDLTYARKLGVQADDLLVSQPDTGEQALEIAETLGPQRRDRCDRRGLGRALDAAR